MRVWPLLLLLLPLTALSAFPPAALRSGIAAAPEAPYLHAPAVNEYARHDPSNGRFPSPEDSGARAL